MTIYAFQIILFYRNDRPTSYLLAFIDPNKYLTFILLKYRYPSKNNIYITITFINKFQLLQIQIRETNQTILNNFSFWLQVETLSYTEYN